MTHMDADAPETVICRYSVKPGSHAEMIRLLSRHWPTLHHLGLVTDEKPIFLRGIPSPKEKPGPGASSNVILEIFTWKSSRSAAVAHVSPEVMAIWEPMGALCDSMEFPHFEKVGVVLARK